MRFLTRTQEAADRIEQSVDTDPATSRKHSSLAVRRFVRAGMATRLRWALIAV